MSNFLQHHGPQHTKFLCFLPSPRVCSNSCPLSCWCYLIMLFSATLFSFCLQSFPALGYFPVSCLFTSGNQSIAASSSVSLLPMNIQGWFPIGLTDLMSLLSKGFSRVFSRLQFESIHSSVLRLLYGPTFTFIHDNWKNRNFGCMDNCWQNDVSAFSYAVYIFHSFLSKQQASFTFMALVTICSNFEAQENEVCHYFQIPPFYLPWSDGTRCHDLSFLNVEF